MANNSIKKVQILAELDNGEFGLAVSENPILIRVIIELCRFIRVDKSAVGNVDVKEITKGGEEKK